MKIGQAIRKVRREQGATLESIALAAGTDAANLSRIERGRQGFSPEMLGRIARALKLPLSALYQRIERESTAPSEAERDDSTRILRKSLEHLTPENRALALEFVKLLARLQKDHATE